MEANERYSLRRHYGRLGFALLAYYLVAAAAQFAVHYGILAWAPAIADTGWYLPALAFLPMYCIAFPGFLLLLPKAPPRELLPEKSGLPVKGFFLLLLMCFGILYPCNLLGRGLDWVVRSLLHRAGEATALDALAGGSETWAFVLAAVILGPIMEELTFRKLLIDRMRTIDKPSALLYSALAFGLFHANLVQFFYAFGVGLLFGAVYLRTGKVRYTIGLHMLVNFFGSAASLFLLEHVDLSDPFRSLLPALGLIVYGLAIAAAAIAGIVMLVKHRRMLHVGDGEDRLGPGSRFSLVFARPGWVLYVLCILVMTAVNYLL